MKKRRNFTPEFKTQVVLELLREEKGLNRYTWTGSKKSLNKLLDVAGKKELVTRTDSNLPISTQCKLLDLNRKSVYYKKQSPNDLEIEIKHIIDHPHTEHPAWGTRRITATLIAKGYRIGRKLVRRYMQEMRIYAIYPKPNLSSPNKQNLSLSFKESTHHYTKSGVVH